MSGQLNSWGQSGFFRKLLAALVAVLLAGMYSAAPGQLAFASSGGEGGGNAYGGAVPAAPAAPVAPREGPGPEPVLESIEDEQAPRANIVTWALLNLMFTILTGLIMVALIATYFVKRREDGREEGEEEALAGDGEGVAREGRKEKGRVERYLGLRLITVPATAVSIMLFVMSQDMRLPMTLFDYWTVWHVLIAGVSVVLAFFSRKKYVPGDEGAEEDGSAATK